MVHLALDGRPTPASVLDPACGGGVFLVAAADALYQRGVLIEALLGQVLHGQDIDPLAVQVAEVVLTLWARQHGAKAVPTLIRCVDSLATATEWGAHHLVVGNPPFRSPVGRRGSTRAAAGGAGLLDDAARFLERAEASLQPGGRCCLLAPRSMLAAADAVDVREATLRSSALRAIWFDEAPVFEGTGVRVAAPLLERGGKPATQVQVLVGVELTSAGSIDAATLAGSWGPALAVLEGVPIVPSGGSAGRLGDRWHVTAGHRQHFYAIAAAACEHEATHDACCPVITVGLIDPLVNRWGRRSARLNRRDLAAPCVELAAVARHSPQLEGWLAQRQQPKVLVGTQGRVVEAVADPEGRAVPCTPVVSVEGDDPFAALAVLLAPRSTALLASMRAGTGLAAGSIRVSAASLRELPLPADTDAWAAAGAHLRVRHERADEPDAAWLDELGQVLCSMYGDEPALGSWWAARLGRRTTRGRRGGPHGDGA